MTPFPEQPHCLPNPDPTGGSLETTGVLLFDLTRTKWNNPTAYETWLDEHRDDPVYIYHTRYAGYWREIGRGLSGTPEVTHSVSTAIRITEACHRSDGIVFVFLPRLTEKSTFNLSLNLSEYWTNKLSA